MGRCGGRDWQNKKVEKEVAGTIWVWYNPNVTASESGDRREVFHLDHILSFIVAVAAGVTCHYIIKWLDGDK